MRFIDEYRNPEAVKILTEKIYSTCTREWVIMEVCGGQTHTIVKYGLEDLLYPHITLLHGPGCPVCVTPVEIIDKAVSISLLKNVILVSYGDMLRVPGTLKDLLKAKAEGADIRIVYSPTDAVSIAEAEPDKYIVFFAVGFETTAPANGMAILNAQKKQLKNFFVLCSHILIPPAVEIILSSPYCKVQGLLAPGHVCTITGYEKFIQLSLKYHTPVAVTGFEPVDILQGILGVVEMLENNKPGVVNQYSRSVKQKGNSNSLKVINDVYEVADSTWRGIGNIPGSGLKIKEMFARYDAEKFFNPAPVFSSEFSGCIAGEILQGFKKPGECSLFGNDCIPLKPLGAPMVSSEGICSAYYRYRK